MACSYQTRTEQIASACTSHTKTKRCQDVDNEVKSNSHGSKTGFCRMWDHRGHNEYCGETLTYHVLFDSGVGDNEAADREELLCIIDALGLEVADTHQTLLRHRFGFALAPGLA